MKNKTKQTNSKRTALIGWVIYMLKHPGTDFSFSAVTIGLPSQIIPTDFTA